MTERWLRKLRTRLDSLEIPSDLGERVPDHEFEDSSHNRLGAKLAAGGIALLIVGGLAVGAWLLLRPLTQLSPGAGGSDAVIPPDTVRVVCGEQTELRTSSVTEQPDGVHFQLSNPASAGALFVRDSQDPQMSWMRGALADRDSADFTLPVPPGEVLVVCLHPPVNTLELPREEFAPLTILPTR